MTTEQRLARRLRGVAEELGEPPCSPKEALGMSLLRELAGALDAGVLAESEAFEAVVLAALAFADLSTMGPQMAREALRLMSRRVPRCPTPEEPS